MTHMTETAKMNTWMNALQTDDDDNVLLISIFIADIMYYIFVNTAGVSIIKLTCMVR